MKGLTPFFWLSLIIFTLNQILERFITLPYLHAYLDDVLCPPIVLGAVLAIFQNFLDTPNYTFHWHYVVFFGLWYTLYFEIIYPSYDLRHYADYWDVLAYAIGCYLFFIFGNKPQKLKGVITPNDVRKNAV